MGRRRAEKNARRLRRRRREVAGRVAAPPARTPRVLKNGMTVDEHLAELQRFIDALGHGHPHGQESFLELDRDAEDRVPDLDAVLALGTDPLPGEGRSTTQLAPTGRRVVDHVLDLAEPVAVSIGGVELRTSLRRFTAMAAAADLRLLLDLPPRRAAAAAVWAVGQINGCFTPISLRPEVLLGRLGQDTCYVDDGRRLLRALGWEDEDDAWYTVRHPRLTTSTTRAELFREELDDDWYEEWDEDDWDEGDSGFWDEHASHM